MFNALSHCWICYAWLPLSSQHPIYWHLPCNWCMHFQLGRPKCYQANNIAGQWKRATIAAAVAACNGLGGIAEVTSSGNGGAEVHDNDMDQHWQSILMIAVVGACSLLFWRANWIQRKGKKTNRECGRVSIYISSNKIAAEATDSLKMGCFLHL